MQKLAWISSSCFKNQRLGLADGLLHCQDANEMIANPQVIAFCLNIRVRNLEVEELPASPDGPQCAICRN